jgi:hypothetical protein
MPAYSFLDVSATLVGAGGFIDLGNGSAAAEEGITIEMGGDKNTMMIGADGEGMHSLHADKSGTITFRLLKTSPANQKLMAMYALQTSASNLHGQNVISITNTKSGDVTVAREAAFKKKPTIAYAKDGNVQEWVFDCIKIDTLLGTF